MTKHKCANCGEENEVFSTAQKSFVCFKCGSIMRIFDIVKSKGDVTIISEEFNSSPQEMDLFE